MEEGSKVMSAASSSAPTARPAPISTASEMTEAAKLFSEIAQPWIADPAKLVEAQGALVRDYMQLVGATPRSA